MKYNRSSTDLICASSISVIISRKLFSVSSVRTIVPELHATNFLSTGVGWRTDSGSSYENVHFGCVSLPKTVVVVVAYSTVTLVCHETYENLVSPPFLPQQLHFDTSLYPSKDSRPFTPSYACINK